MSSEPLPEEIERLCAERVRLLRERPGEGLPFDPLADLARAILSECERRYARREEVFPLETPAPVWHKHGALPPDVSRPAPPPKEPEVEPCPWCGGNAVMDKAADEVRCMGECAAFGPSNDPDASRWNRVSRAARGVR